MDLYVTVTYIYTENYYRLGDYGVPCIIPASIRKSIINNLFVKECIILQGLINRNIFSSTRERKPRVYQKKKKINNSSINDVLIFAVHLECLMVRTCVIRYFLIRKNCQFLKFFIYNLNLLIGRLSY